MIILTSWGNIRIKCYERMNRTVERGTMLTLVALRMQAWCKKFKKFIKIEIHCTTLDSMFFILREGVEDVKRRGRAFSPIFGEA